MPRVRGANEMIVADVQPVPRGFEALRILVAMRLRGYAALFSGLLDLLPMLVRAGQEERLVAQKLVVARQHVGQYGGVGVPDMRRVVDVVDGGGDVECFIGHR